MNLINFASIRTRSVETAKLLGYATNPGLPLLNSDEVIREASEVIDRLLGMYCIAAVAYGFERTRALTWIERNTDAIILTSAERRFLLTGAGSTQHFKFQIEGIWALYWSCGLTDAFSFAEHCPQDFVTRLPNLKRDENSQQFKSRVRQRTTSEVVAMADLAYCIHWAVRESELRGLGQVANIQEYVIRERRHAFEWLLTSHDWDDISLDT